MAIDPQVRLQHLAAVIGRAAVGHEPDQLPDAATFTAWIQDLLKRHGCADPVQVGSARRQGMLSSGAETPVGENKDLECHFLRLALKMAEATYRNILAPRPPVDPELLARFEALVSERPLSLPKFFQGQIDPVCSVRRAMEIQRCLGLGLNAVLFVGDDDLTSLALALLAPEYTLRVIDIDERVLSVIEKGAKSLGVPVQAEYLDLRQGVPFHFAGRFEGVVTDPPRNSRSCLGFLRFAKGCLADLDVSRLFWSDHPDWTLNHAEVMAQLPRMGLRCVEVVPELHFYPDAHEESLELEHWVYTPSTGDQDLSSFIGILDALAQTFQLEPYWIRSVAHWSMPWSHLHILARSAPVS